MCLTEKKFENSSGEKGYSPLAHCVNPCLLYTSSLKKLVGAIRYRFAYPEIEKSLKLTSANKNILLKTLRAVIGTLDPTLQDVSLSKDLKDTLSLIHI